MSVGLAAGWRRLLTSPSSGAPRLEWSEAQQRKPVRMVFAGHDFAGAFAAALGTAAAREAPVVQEEPQQIQVRVAQVAAQCEVGAQSRVAVLHQRIATRCLRHGPADGLEQRVELAVSRIGRSQPLFQAPPSVFHLLYLLAEVIG
jgi:hypothetical protein